MYFLEDLWYCKYWDCICIVPWV